MRTNIRPTVLKCLVCVACYVGFAGAQETAQTQSRSTSGLSEQAMLRIANEVRKQIVSLPEYGVFDDIHFGIKGSTVILRGEASRPILKSSAENVVKKIEGVTAVGQ